MFEQHKLSLQNLSCQRGEHILFRALTCDFNSGDFVQIEGHNGIGKTSLLRILAGLAQPLEGEVRWILKRFPNNVNNIIRICFI